MRLPVVAAVAALSLFACKGKESEGGAKGKAAPASQAASAAPKAKSLDFPGTKAGAEDLLKSFMKEGADHIALSKALRPQPGDYAKVFKGPAAEQAKAGYTAPWDAGAIVVKPKPGQTELKLWAATSEQLAAGEGDASQFPGGYGKVKAHLQPGLTFYRFKFVKPGEPFGMAFDGLVHVDGHWALFPKPWRVLK